MKTKFKTSNRILSLVLALVMMVSMLPMMSIMAEAATTSTSHYGFTATIEPTDPYFRLVQAEINSISITNGTAEIELFYQLYSGGNHNFRSILTIPDYSCEKEIHIVERNQHNIANVTLTRSAGHYCEDWQSVADGKHTGTCKVCGQTALEDHEYTNDCDTSCNICGNTRTIEHSYHYSASENTITETCDRGCEYNLTATLRLKSNADLTYTGSAIEPCEIDYPEGWVGTQVQPNSESYANNKNVGEATCTVTYSEGVTVTKKFNITPAKMTVTASGYSGTYDSAPHGITINVPEGATVKYGTAEGTYELEESPTRTDVGSTTVYYQVTKANYNTVTASATVTINPATITITPDSGQSMTWESAMPELTYKDSGRVGSEIPAFTGKLGISDPNAGQCTITMGTLALADNGSFKASNYTLALTPVAFTIYKANGSASVRIEDWTYGDTPKAPVPDSSTNGVSNVTYLYKEQDAEDSTYTNTVPTAVGNYTVKATFAATNNYKEATAIADFEISKRTVTVIADNASKTYGGADPELKWTVTSGTELASEPLSINISRAEGDNAGDYTITVSQTEGANANYDITFINGTFTINKAPLTVTAENKTATYGDKVPTYTVTYSGFVSNDNEDILDGTLAFDCDYAQFSDKGTYTITPKGYESGNYEITYFPGTLTVNAKTITETDVKLNGSLTYNGKEQTQPITVAEGITYEVSGNKATNAGEYELTVKGTGNYTGSINVKWSIAKAAVTITAENKVIYVGAGLPTLTYTVSGLVEGEKLTKEPTLTTNADAAIAGSYVITVANANAGDNYEISYVGGTLTVMDAETEVETKIEQTELTEVPDGLKNTEFNTVEAITEELVSRILATSTGYAEENMEHYDVTLQFSLDGGNTWILATEENFPTEGITVILPYPEGTNARDYEFVVSHMFTVTSQRLGTTAGDVELPKVEETANGIRVTLNGLSPVTVAARYHDHTGGTATCTDKAACSICGNGYGELDGTNHAGDTEVKDAKEATCGADGYTGDSYCKGCNEVVEKGTTIKATGEHTYGNWKVVKEPTKTAKGEKQRTCSVCGHVDSKEIPVLSDTPATGDDSNIMLWSGMLCVSTLGLVVLLADRKRRNATK